MLIRIMGSLILMFKNKQKYEIAKELLNEKNTSIYSFTYIHDTPLTLYKHNQSIQLQKY